MSKRKHDGRAHYGRTAAIGLGVGAYDGFLGPGTGSFFVILLVGVLGYGFLEASAKAKIANLITNLAAIFVFALHGSVLWALGLSMGAANLVGGLLGARTAIRRGNAFIRKVFLVVLAGLIIKLAYDLVVQLRGVGSQPLRHSRARHRAGLPSCATGRWWSPTGRTPVVDHDHRRPRSTGRRTAAGDQHLHDQLLRRCAPWSD